MTGDEIGGLVDKVAEKLGVASEQVLGAFQALAAEYQTANIVAAAICISIAVLTILLGAWVRAGGLRIAKAKTGYDKDDWVACVHAVSWTTTALVVAICVAVATVRLYYAMMPRVSLLAELGLLR